MIVILKQGITPQEKDKVRSFLSEKGFIVKEIVGQQDTVLGAVGKVSIDPRTVELMPGVSSVVPISKPYKLASREMKKEDTIVQVGKVKIGGNRVAVIAGPCAVENYDQIMTIAESVREAGAVMLRGGAFKPRTSPYAFQGLGEEGLKLLRKAGDVFDMPITTEVVSPSDVKMMAGYVVGVPVRLMLAQLRYLFQKLRSLHGNLQDLLLRLVEYLLSLGHRGGIVHMHDGLLHALQGLEGLADDMLPGLGQHLNRHIVGDQILLNQRADKGVLRLGRCREAYLDLLKSHLAQKLEEANLLLQGHGHHQRLVAVA